MDNEPAQLNASILANEKARAAYYEQRRQNTAAREQQERQMRAVNWLTEVTQFEIERATQKQMTPDEFTSLRGRIQQAVQRLDIRG